MAGKTTNTPKILIVDDEAAILDALGLYLKQKGYEVETVVKFDDYLEKTKASKLPDLFILDILLNHEDGIKITKKLKKSPKTENIPIILISALPDGKKLSIESGASAFLPKPFDVEQLNETIERFIKVPDF